MADCRLPLLWSVSLFITVFQVRCSSYEDSRRLYRDLFHRYDKMVRPVLNQNIPISIQLDMYLMSIRSLDEVKQEMSVIAWFRVSWQDELLKWKPDRYGGLERVRLPASRIWRPLLFLSNTADTFQTFMSEEFQLEVSPSGRVVWHPSGRFTARCKLDVTRYPFDDQRCSFRLGSWMDFSSTVLIRPTKPTVTFDDYQENSQWAVSDTRVQAVLRPDITDPQYNYSMVEFVIRLRRKRAFHVLTTYMPFVVMSLLNLATHIMPINTGEKLALASSSLMSFTLLLNSFSSKIPVASEYISILATCLTILLTISTASVWIAAIQLRLSRSKQRQTTPKQDAEYNWDMEFGDVKHESCVALDFIHRQSPDDEPGHMENFLNSFVSKRDRRMRQRKKQTKGRRKQTMTLSLMRWFSWVAIILTILTAIAPVVIMQL